MSKILPYLLLTIPLLLPPYANSQQVDTGGQSTADAAGQPKTDNSTNTPPETTSQPGTSAPSAGGAPPAGSGQQDTQGSGAAGNTSNTDQSKPNQESAQPAAAQPATTAAPAATETNNSQAEKAQPSGEQPAAPDSAASEALKASKEEQEKQKESVKEVVQQEGGGLISGKFQISLSESYSHSDNSQLYIHGFGILPIVVVGDVSVQKVRRDSFTTSLSASYKLTDTMQVSLSVPYQYMVAHTSESTGIRGNSVVSTNTDEVTETSELGDISGSLSYALMNERIGRPGLNLGVSLKARNGRDVFETPDPAAKPPVGTGFYSVRGSISASKSSAPAVLFGSMAVAYNVKRTNILYTPKGKTPSILGSYQAGMGLSFSEGIGLSLNYDLSLNFSFAQSVNFPSKLNGNPVSNSRSTAMSFTLGGNYRINNKTSISLSFTNALSLDAGGYSMSLSVPWRF